MKSTLFKLAQKVRVGRSSQVWVDILTTTNEGDARIYAILIKLENPDAILGLRMIQETELEL